MSTPQTSPQIYPVPGEMVPVNGHRLHLHSAGSGSPAVVFEAAIMDFSPTWALVQPGVADFTRAVAYDRAGLGWSESGRPPRDGENMVAELRRLLQAARIAAPYVLVGQSFSGLLCRLYAYLYPEEVAGLVLLDPAHEDQYTRFPQAILDLFAPIKEMQFQQLRAARELAAAGNFDQIPALVPIPAAMPPEKSQAYARMAKASPDRFDAMIAELEALETTQQQVRALRARGLGDIPLFVLSHGVPQAVPGVADEVNAAYEASWQQMQAEITAQSSAGTHLVAERSGHMIQHDQPELVVETIRQAVELARGL